MKNNIIKRMVTGLLAATLFVGTAAVSNPTEVKAEVFYNQYLPSNQDTYGLNSITPEIKSFTRTGLTTAKVKVYIPYSKELTLVSDISKCTDSSKSYLINYADFRLSSNDNVFSKVSIDAEQEGHFIPGGNGKCDPGLAFETVKDGKGKAFRYTIDTIASKNLKRVGKNTYTFTVKSNALKKYKNIYITARFGAGDLEGCLDFDPVTTNTNTAKLTSNSSKYKCVKKVAMKRHKGHMTVVTYSCVQCGYTSKQYFKVANHISKYYDEGHYSYDRYTGGKDTTIPTYYKYTWKKK